MGDFYATLQQTIGGPRAWEGFEPETFWVLSEYATTIGRCLPIMGDLSQPYSRPLEVLGRGRIR
jgi:hypothetical protein